jgi:23S rRNA pseudouridine1911/1915/1917 synthase
MAIGYKLCTVAGIVRTRERQKFPHSHECGYATVLVDCPIANNDLNEESVHDPDWLLLEDGPLIAVNKPAGILTEGIPAGEQTMVGLVKSWLSEKYQKPGNVYLGIPHRLDRATSGTIVFTRNSKAAARVAEQFEKRQVSKTYWALLEKRPDDDAGLLVDWLLKVPDQAISEVVSEGTPRAKEARLEYRVLHEIKGRWLVEILLLTGRMHQIRVQFASRGCPVAGDSKYGGGEWPDPDTDGTNDDLMPAEIPTAASEKSVSAAASSASDNAMEPVHLSVSDLRIALHARSLSLLHPIRYDKLIIDSPVPAYWGLSGESFPPELWS